MCKAFHSVVWASRVKLRWGHPLSAWSWKQQSSLCFAFVYAKCGWALAGDSAEQQGELWTLSSWSLQLVLQVSKGSFYDTAWCYPVGTSSGTLCVAASSLSWVPGWVTSACLRRKAGSEKESRVLVWDSVWPEPYRWIWDAEKKALRKSPIQGTKRQCASALLQVGQFYQGNFILCLNYFYTFP